MVRSYTTAIASPYFIDLFIKVLRARETFKLISQYAGEISK